MKFRNKLMVGIMFIGAFFARIETDAFETVIYANIERTLEKNFALKNENGETFLILKYKKFLTLPNDKKTGLALLRRPDGTGTFVAELLLQENNLLRLVKIYEFNDDKELKDELELESFVRNLCDLAKELSESS